MEVNILDSSIGLRIREVRNRFGLSQTEFGKRLDVSRDVMFLVDYIIAHKKLKSREF